MNRIIKAVVIICMTLTILLGSSLDIFAANKSAKNVICCTEFADIILDENGTLWAYTPSMNGNPEKKLKLSENIASIDEIGGGSCGVFVLKKDSSLWEISFRADGSFDGIKYINIAQNVKSFDSELDTILAVTNDNYLYYIGMNSGVAAYSVTPMERYNYTKMDSDVEKALNYGMYLKTDGSVMAKGIYCYYDGNITWQRLKEWTKIFDDAKDICKLCAGIERSYYVIKEDGSLYSFGGNSYGQLGNGGQYLTWGSSLWGVGNPGPITGVFPLELTYEEPLKVLDNISYVLPDDYGNRIFAYCSDGSIFVLGGSERGQASYVNSKADKIVKNIDANKSKPQKVTEAEATKALSNCENIAFGSPLLERVYQIADDGTVIVSGNYLISRAYRDEKENLHEAVQGRVDSVAISGIKCSIK
jgi:hypothetical protein